MGLTLPPFAASVVGSLPRPAWVLDLLHDDAIDPAVRTARMDAAIAAAVAMQEHAGLDVVTDGEWRRRSYIGVIADLAHGFSLSRAADGRPWTVVTGEVAPQAPGFVAAEARFVRGVTKRAVKATLPSPALLAERMWDPEASARAYPTREAFARACVPILRREIELVIEAGADIVQIDDPHLCLFVDDDVRRGYADPEAAAGFAVDVVNELVHGVDGVRFAVHLCRRAGARVRGEHQHEGGYDRIVHHVNRLAVHEVTMEFTSDVQGGAEVLGRLRHDLSVGLGCVDVTPGRVDDVDTIVARVERALPHLSPERIVLNPDCGFAPGSGARVDLDEVWTKLQHEGEAAARLRAHSPAAC
jgi:5-methyltetrahydropteroyltriglutamate--homocysteine methyltransferase